MVRCRHPFHRQDWDWVGALCSYEWYDGVIGALFERCLGSVEMWNFILEILPLSSMLTADRNGCTPVLGFGSN